MKALFKVTCPEDLRSIGRCEEASKIRTSAQDIDNDLTEILGSRVNADAMDISLGELCIPQMSCASEDFSL